jgi:hypothetical protein
MLRSMKAVGVALALLVAPCVLSPVCSDTAFAQPARPYVNAVDVDVVPGQIDNYLTALQENGRLGA